MAPNSTTRPAGIFLLRRGSRKSSASAAAPTAKVVQLAWGSSLIVPTSFSIVLPSGFSTPKSLLSCPTVTKMARPTTKPSMTGLERNCVMKPSSRQARRQEHRAGDQHEGGRVGRVGLRIGRGRPRRPPPPRRTWRGAPPSPTWPGPRGGARSRAARRSAATRPACRGPLAAAGRRCPRRPCPRAPRVPTA